MNVVGSCPDCLWDFECEVPPSCPGDIPCENCLYHFADCDSCIHKFTPLPNDYND